MSDRPAESDLRRWLHRLPEQPWAILGGGSAYLRIKDAKGHVIATLAHPTQGRRRQRVARQMGDLLLLTPALIQEVLELREEVARLRVENATLRAKLPLGTHCGTHPPGEPDPMRLAGYRRSNQRIDKSTP